MSLKGKAAAIGIGELKPSKDAARRRHAAQADVAA